MMMWWIFYPTSSCQNLKHLIHYSNTSWKLPCCEFIFFWEFCQLETILLLMEEIMHHMSKTLQNNARFSISTGERRISEPSTAPNFSNFALGFSFGHLGHHTSIRPVPQPSAAVPTGPVGPGAIYHKPPNNPWKNMGFWPPKRSS